MYGTMSEPNVTQAVPFFGVRDIEASVRFYTDGLGGVKTIEWRPEGKLRWCWIEIGSAAVMLQEFLPQNRPEGTFGLGMSICFMCKDAIRYYKELKSRGLEARRPFVGNGYWVTSVVDPDGYELYFESITDAPEETEYSE
jgi:lactoylglutathione lyase